MSADRWAAIDRVWHAVLDRPESERAAALDELCAGDAALRDDVASLLAHLARASAAGFGAAHSAPQATLVGRQIGPYTIHALLGAGGMGEVYQAHDATLGRDVAIKIVPDLWLATPERQSRFEREARLLASLNHPNIGAIYGVHESDGTRALVLELIDGETLAERIARQTTDPARPRGLPTSEVLSIAGQIAEAIEAAHERGIIHRDLKPSNIKITTDGRVKVLDFGLARASGAEAGTDVTIEGVLLGTAAYMSPEQARGRAVDTRTDIWAFGCVLYEMVTGVKAFGGDGLAEVLANVIKGEPDWSLVPDETPPALRLCLRRSLQKDARQRFHHIGDVRLAITGAFEIGLAGGDVDRHRRRRGRAILYGAIAAALLAVAVVTAVIVRRNPGSGGSAPAQSPMVLFSPGTGGGGGAGTAPTIQAALDQVAPGGTVTVLPGTYAESLTIRKGLTLKATGERSGTVVLVPGGTPESVIEIATTEPVTLEGLTLHVSGAHGIRAIGAVNVTLLKSNLLAVNPPTGWSRLVFVSNDRQQTGARARAVVQDNSLDGAVPKSARYEARPRNHAVRLVGDVDGVIERNIIRRTGDVCVVVVIRDDLSGETNAEIVNNDIDECHPVARVGAILVGTQTVLTLSPDRPITATGQVNIIGNTLRNSSADCLTAAIMFDVLGGRIERNRIVDFVQPCATQTTRNMPSAIWLGLRGPGIPPVPPVVPTVRFNDIFGNARAGFRVASNQKIPVDVSCNYWGSERGPSGIGPGDGDPILVEPGAATPTYTPFAKSPVAQRRTPGC